MITSMWPASLTFEKGDFPGKDEVYQKPVPTTAKVSLVSKLLQTLCWASLLYTVRTQQTEPFPANFDLASLDGANGFIINGNTTGEQSGWSVSSAGDVNGDGLADILIGAKNANPLGRLKAGVSYVLFGTRNYSSILGNGNSFELAELNGLNGFTINGEAAYDQSGSSVSSVGDVNNDGLADFVISAFNATISSRSNAGKSYVVYGSRSIVSGGALELSSLNGTNGFMLNGEAADDESGISASSAGDVNGDGIDDIVIGAHNADPSGTIDAGKSYVVYGNRSLASGGVLELSSLDGTNGFILNGHRNYDRSGQSVSSAGDVNGDGIDDLVIGAYYATPTGGSPSAGKSYVVYGSRSIVRGGLFELSNLNGTNGFILNGEEIGDFSGRSVSSAGDMNGDGLSDLVIGAQSADPSGMISAGKSYLVYGRQFVSGGILELSSLNGTSGFIMKGEATGDFSGRSVSSAGDVNGDGFADIVIGAFQATPFSRTSAGKSYVVYGSRSIVTRGVLELSSLNGTNGFILNGEKFSDVSGRSVSSAGDVNGDGISDILIGANGGDPSNRYSAGKSYVIFGRNFAMTTKRSQTTTHTTSSRVTTKLTSPITTISSSQMTPTPTSSATPFNQASSITTSHVLSSQTSIPSSSTVSIQSSLTKDGASENPITSSQTSKSISFITLSQELPTAISTPLIAGIAGAVAALACSIFGGVLIYCKKRPHSNTPDQGTALPEVHPDSAVPASYVSISTLQTEMDSARVESIYSKFPSGTSDSHYNEWPQKQTTSSSDQYTSIDKLEKAHDEYEAAKIKKNHEEEDDLST